VDGWPDVPVGPGPPVEVVGRDELVVPGAEDPSEVERLDVVLWPAPGCDGAVPGSVPLEVPVPGVGEPVVVVGSATVSRHTSFSGVPESDPLTAATTVSPASDSPTATAI
jgi:hypothetical protein